MKSALSLLIVVLVVFPLEAQPLIATKDVVTGLDTPWEILWGPDNWIWMTERYGRISRLNPANGEIREIARVPGVYETAECGLLGMALHPHFADSPYVYCAYTASASDSTYGIHIARFTYSNDTLSDQRILLDPNLIVGGTIHDGCRLLIDSTDMTMYITTGDADHSLDFPQSDQSYNGKVLRMNLDGSVPADNPISGSLVWSKGHRNAQGLAFGPHGLLYETMHGTFEEDELNIIEKGGNYGWPFVNGYCDWEDEKKFCKDSSVIEPIYSWTPTIAPAGCAYYDRPEFPQFYNSLLIAVLKGDGGGKGYLLVLRLDSSGTTVIDTAMYFHEQFGRLRDLCIAPDGRIYIATSNQDTKGFPKEDDDRIVLVYNPANVSSVLPHETSALMLRPNPMTGERAEFLVPDEYIGSGMEVCDALGRTIRRERIESTETYIDRKDLKSGVYLLHLYAQNPHTMMFIVN